MGGLPHVADRQREPQIHCGIRLQAADRQLLELCHGIARVGARNDGDVADLAARGLKTFDRRY